MILRLLLIFAFVSGTNAHALIKSFDSTEIEKLSLENSIGKIHFLSAPNNAKLSIEAEQVNVHEWCKINIEKVGKQLVIESINTSFTGLDNCQVNWKIRIPHKIHLKIKNGQGNISIKPAMKDLDLQLGSGNISIRGQIETLVGELGHGNIKIKGIKRKVDFNIGSGNLDLSFAKNSDAGSININTGRGNVAVHLPKEAMVSTKLQTGIGKITNKFSKSPIPNFELSLKSGIGDISILKLK